MVMLVTLQQASDHLRRDTTDDDADLTLKIHAASNAIVNYLKNPLIVYKGSYDSSGEYVADIDSSGETELREEVLLSVLYMIGVFYADRQAQDYIEGNTEDRLGKMSLPKPVHFMLDAIRKPSMA